MSDKKDYSLAKKVIIQEIKEIENPKILALLFKLAVSANKRQKEEKAIQQGETA